MIGKKIQNYEIISLIGEGGMGNVYLAEDKKVGRKVAIKIILPHLAKNEHVRDRFIMEAKTMARLQHVNIVTLYDYVVNEEGLFLIMEYVDGNPLDEYIQNIGKAIDEDLAIEVTKQVVSACDHAHSKGVVHRDIKPGNIIINKEGTVKILDFGIAKIIDGEVSKLTKTGLQIGTVYYMSPEQVQGGEITAQTDIYSIGVTLYQMVTAINPYKQFSTEFQIYKKIVDEPLADVRDIHSELSPFINVVIQKATEKKPENRFKNCEEFLDMLNGKAEYLDKIVSPVAEPKLQTVKKLDRTFINLLFGGSIASVVFAISGFGVCFFAFLALMIGATSFYFGNKEYKKSISNSEFQSNEKFAKIIRIVSIVGVGLSILVMIICLFLYINKDSDNDGFPDRSDNCPYETGDIYGCPDYDGDGVTDDKDECMYKSGDKSHNGCPDTDSDGLYDNEDECEDVYGPKENNGCPWPDADGDGVPDRIDICPNEFGDESNNGCPLEDSDNDGTADKYDSCPDEYGSEENGGCPWPDSDNDGVLDKNDDCPNEYGPNANSGCPWPDSDNDGIIDRYDVCPNVYGTKSNGCPSTSSSNTWGNNSSGSTSTKTDTYKKIVFTNNSSIPIIYVAVVYWDGNTWVTKGWYHSKSGSSVEFSLPKNYSSSRFYYSASGGGYTWTKNGINKCVSNNSFTYYDNVSNSCPETKKFLEKSISGNTTYVNFGN